MSLADNRSSDVIVLGAGLAGTCAAFVLARQGRHVNLIDPRSVYPSSFKAEKIEPEQVELFRKLGLLDTLVPLADSIREVLEGDNGRIRRRLRLQQYGIRYDDLVNQVRRSLPATVQFREARVERVAHGPDLQRVTLSTGEELAARLVVVASGTGGHVHERLGVSRRVICAEPTAGFGFTIARDDGKPFPFEALTYFPNGCATRIGYLTLFPMRRSMRANLFVFRALSEEWVRRFVRQPRELLQDALPKLTRLTGDFHLVGRVETAKTDLYVVENHLQPGLVLIGDAFMSVCPTSGLGLSKVLTDVDVLSECVPEWFATPGMGVEKIGAFYDHARKRTIDQSSLDSARYRRQLSTDASLAWRARRLRDHARRWFDSIRERVR